MERTPQDMHGIPTMAPCHLMALSAICGTLEGKIFFESMVGCGDQLISESDLKILANTTLMDTRCEINF